MAKGVHRPLVVLLPDTSHYPAEAHLLLSQRLVLMAIAESRATEISFVDCPILATSFDCVAQEGPLDLREKVILSVLGYVPWLVSEASVWAELLIPTRTLTGYVKKRQAQQLSREHMALAAAGIPTVTTEKLLGQLTWDELKHEASVVVEGLKRLKPKPKLKDLTSVFKMKKTAERAHEAEIPTLHPLTLTPITDIFQEALVTDNPR